MYTLKIRRKEEVGNYLELRFLTRWKAKKEAIAHASSLATTGDDYFNTLENGHYGSKDYYYIISNDYDDYVLLFFIVGVLIASFLFFIGIAW